MEFNSYLFLFAFLPVSLVVYYSLALSRLHRLRLPALCLLTMAFYANAAAHFLPLLLVSLIFNYLCATAIWRTDGRTRHTFLVMGLAANVGALLYYKYSIFLLQSAGVLFGKDWTFARLALPLAISFYTFQQIAFLVDSARGRVKNIDALAYASSILFFPYIVSGPITFFREVGPQLAARPSRHDVPGNLLIGLVMFAIGLFKKTVIADTYALWVNPLYQTVQNGHSLGTGGMWLVAVGFLFQVYFDFSGYSDMANGLARMLGIDLPLNFHAPLRVTSIIDYWRRWHITLGRFVNLYIFVPISVPLSRFAAERDFGRFGMLAVGTLFPTFITMVIIGAWHGGSWNFILFGVLHGSFMVLNEAYRFITRKRRKGRQPTRIGTVAAHITTMIAVVSALVTFRAPDLAITGRVWAQMLGFGDPAGGFAWPILPSLGAWGLLLGLVPGACIAYLLPTTQQFVERYEPVLEWSKWRTIALPPVRFTWRPHLAWSLAIGTLMFAGAAFVARGSASFVYFGF